MHVPLVLNAQGQRLAKRDGAVTFREMTEVFPQIARSLNIEANTASELLAVFDPTAVPREPYIWMEEKSH